MSDEHDDIIIEPESSAHESEHEDDLLEEGGFEKKVGKLQQALKKSEAEKKEYLDGWQRAKADFVNFSRRAGEEQKMADLRGRTAIIATLLPALDGFVGALADKTLSDDGREGILRIYENIVGALEKEGVTPLGSVGEVFDPTVAEAVGSDSVDDEKKDNTVTAVLSPGWKIGEYVVRPARVRVGQFEN